MRRRVALTPLRVKATRSWPCGSGSGAAIWNGLGATRRGDHSQGDSCPPRCCGGAGDDPASCASRC